MNHKTWCILISSYEFIFQLTVINMLIILKKCIYVEERSFYIEEECFEFS